MDKNSFDMAVRFIKAHNLNAIPLHSPLSEGKCTCGRNDCNAQGKHPRENDWVNKGVQGAVGLQALADRYGRNLNVGILTGPTNRIIVIDVDPKHGGDTTMAQWIAEHGPLPETLTVETGQVGEKRGKHLYFQYPDFEVGNKIGSIGAGIDVKGKGGMAVVKVQADPAELAAPGEDNARSIGLVERQFRPDRIAASGKIGRGPDRRHRNVLAPVVELLAR